MARRMETLTIWPAMILLLCSLYSASTVKLLFTKNKEYSCYETPLKNFITHTEILGSEDLFEFYLSLLVFRTLI